MTETPATSSAANHTGLPHQSRYKHIARRVALSLGPAWRAERGVEPATADLVCTDGRRVRLRFDNSTTAIQVATVDSDGNQGTAMTIRTTTASIVATELRLGVLAQDSVQAAEPLIPRPGSEAGAAWARRVALDVVDQVGPLTNGYMRAHVTDSSPPDSGVVQTSWTTRAGHHHSIRARKDRQLVSVTFTGLDRDQALELLSTLRRLGAAT